MTIRSATDLSVNFSQFFDATHQLAEFVAIPSVSDPNNPDYNIEHLEKAAKFAGSKLEELGFDVKYTRIENSAPFVIAKRMINKDLPTIALYGHYDVQPVDREKWKSDPFVLEKRDQRLYGRGSSDDKAGIISILTALRVYRDAYVELPVNVKILFEGEEEYSSVHMNALLKQEAENLKAHALVILDGLNRDVKTGTLTSSTRGVVNIKLRVDALEKPVHSGIGCLVPDPAQALAQLVASLANPRGIPGFMNGCQSMDSTERKLLNKSSQSAESYAKDLGMLPGTSLRGDPGISVYERVLEEPSISIVNMNCGQPDGGNSIQDSAKCTIGIRVLPGQNPDSVADAVVKHLSTQAVKSNLPIDVSVPEKGAWAWKANLSGPFSQAYFKALEENFDQVGAMPCGGALPLIREFQEKFPKMEIIVPGVEDPNTAAHSHNESQDISVFGKAIDSMVSFLAKAGEIPT
jgi:cysteinylglycine-S-conjugate dipeptidase